MHPVSEDAREVVYTPEGAHTNGSGMWPGMVAGLWSSRELVWRFMVRDISARYRQSILGYLWALAPAFVTAIMFTFLVRHRVLDVGETALPYPVFALWSISVWQLFSGTLSGATASLAGAGSLVTKINFCKEALVISAVGQPAIDFLIRLVPIVLVFWWFDVVPSWGALYIPFLLIPVLLLALGIGFFLTVANLVVRDIVNALGVILSFGLFAAPIVYAPPVNYPFALVNVANPFSPMLIATQDLIASGELRNATALVGACVFSCLVFLAGWRTFHLTMPRLAERA